MDQTTHHGQTPLRFGFAETRLGTALAARSSAGLVALLLGSDPSRLRRDLSDAFPEATLVEDPSGLADTLAEIVRLVSFPGGASIPALDPRGSPLELAVWEALRAIPAGETRSYGQIARALPLPATAQDVGRACAANRLAVAIPCHRVVKADGSLSGYRWGVARKRALLQMERAA